jgi:hypothetical protein
MASNLIAIEKAQAEAAKQHPELVSGAAPSVLDELLAAQKGLADQSSPMAKLLGALITDLEAAAV